MATEMVTEESGVAVETVVTNNCVAVQHSLCTAGRGGVGVTVFVEKLAGAAAESGRDLAAVASLARRVNESGRSMGVALTSCTVPAAGRPTFELPDDQMEIGVGIHGEPGRERVPLADAAEIAQRVIEPILADLDFTTSDTTVMCNSMGGSPPIELHLVYGEVKKILDKAGVRIPRNLVGNYTTSLDMAGCSVTILKADDELINLWDAPVKTPALSLRSRDGTGKPVGCAVRPQQIPRWRRC